MLNNTSPYSLHFSILLFILIWRQVSRKTEVPWTLLMHKVQLSFLCAFFFLAFYHVSGFSSHSLEMGPSAWRETFWQHNCLGQADWSIFTLDGKNCLFIKEEFKQERDHKLPLAVTTQKVIRVSKADLHVSCIASSPFMPLSCDRPHEECLEAALYHIYYFVRAAVSAKWWPDTQTDFPN